MKSFFLTLRLFAYQNGFKIKPEYLIPPARLYRSEPPKLSLALNQDYTAPENKPESKKEIQANAFLSLAKEYYNRKQTLKAQENLDRALLLSKANDFSSDLLLELCYIRGLIMLQKKKLVAAYLNFQIFLQLQAQYRKNYNLQEARVRLELAKIFISDREIAGLEVQIETISSLNLLIERVPGLEASIQEIVNSLPDKTDPEQLYILADCHKALAEYQISILDWETAIVNGIACLEILEASELNKSISRKEMAFFKLELAKVLVNICDFLTVTYLRDVSKETLPKIAKIVQETREELRPHRDIFVSILPKLFELLLMEIQNKELHQEIFELLQEAKFEEKDFVSKKDYIESILVTTEGALSLKHYEEGLKLFEQLSEELDNYNDSDEILARFFYLKTQFADKKKDYQEVLNSKRLYEETKTEQRPYYQKWDHQDLMCCIVGIKGNVKLQRFEEAVDEIPLYLEKYEKSDTEYDLREFLAKNIEDSRWERWLETTRNDENGVVNLFLWLNMLMLCAKNEQFSLAEECAGAIKKSGCDVNHDLKSEPEKKSDFILCSSLVEDFVRLIEDFKGRKSYLVSLIEIIPIFCQTKNLLPGNVFILEEIERILIGAGSNISLPLMVKLQTIKAITYYDLEEWHMIVAFLTETIRQIEENNYVEDDFVPVLYNLYGDAVLKSGRGSQKEGEYYLEKGRKMVIGGDADRFKKQNLAGYWFLIDPIKSEDQTVKSKDLKSFE